MESHKIIPKLSVFQQKIIDHSKNQGHHNLSEKRQYTDSKTELAELLELNEKHLRVAIIKVFQEACLKQMKDRTSQQSTQRHKEEPIEISEIQKHNNEIKHTVNEANKKIGQGKNTSDLDDKAIEVTQFEQEGDYKLKNKNEQNLPHSHLWIDQPNRKLERKYKL